MLKKGSHIMTLFKRFTKEAGASRTEEVKTISAGKLPVSKNLEQVENGGTFTHHTRDPGHFNRKRKIRYSGDKRTGGGWK